MAAKPIKTTVKVVIKAAEASPAPPLGPILGQHGLNIMDFVNQYNQKTADMKGNVVPAVITIYEDRTFDFEIKMAPVAEMIKKKLNIEKGSGDVPRTMVGELSTGDLEDIAKEKLPDLNTNDLEAAKKIIAGTARSMGVKVAES